MPWAAGTVLSLERSVGNARPNNDDDERRTEQGKKGLRVPVFNLQSLAGEDALEDAALCVDEMESLTVVPCVAWQSSKMWRARDRRARHHDDMPLAFVVVSSYLFMRVPAWHVLSPSNALRVELGPDCLFREVSSIKRRLPRPSTSMRLPECPYERLAQALAGDK